MSERKLWTDIVTPELKSAIHQAALASYANACELMKDAKILWRENRHARSGVLIILSEEEFSKAFILLICAQQNRWDSVIFDALLRHPEKQGIAEGMREYYNGAMKMSQFSSVPITPAILPDQERFEELTTNAKKVIKHQKKKNTSNHYCTLGLIEKEKSFVTPKRRTKLKLKTTSKK
jgi:AbiV family abortive infection protein